MAFYNLTFQNDAIWRKSSPKSKIFWSFFGVWRGRRLCPVCERVPWMGVLGGAARVVVPFYYISLYRCWCCINFNVPDNVAWYFALSSPAWTIFRSFFDQHWIQRSQVKFHKKIRKIWRWKNEASQLICHSQKCPRFAGNGSRFAYAGGGWTALVRHKN